MPRLHWICRVALVMGLIPAASSAQTRTTASVGLHSVQLPEGITSGLRADVAFGLTSFASSITPYVGLGLVHTSRSSSFGECHVLASTYCMGSSDAFNGLEGFIRLEAGRRFVPSMSLGYTLGRIETHESEGPILLCPSGGALISCPGNPDFHSIVDRRAFGAPLTALGLSEEFSAFGRPMRLTYTMPLDHLGQTSIRRLGMSLGFGF